MSAKAIVWKLLNTTAITALVGDRIVPDEGDADLGFPQIIYEAPTGSPDGIYTGTPTLESNEVTITAIGTSKKMASDVMAAIKTIHGSDGTWNGVEVLDCSLVDSSGTDDVEHIDEETKYFMQGITFKLWYRP